MKKNAIKIVSITLAALIVCGALAFGGWLIYSSPKTVKPVIDESGNENYTFGGFKIVINGENGAFSLIRDGEALFADAVCEYKLGDETFSSADYEKFTVKTAGETLKIHFKNDGKPDIVQDFTFPDGEKYFLVSTELVSKDGLTTNYIAPLVIKNYGVANSGDAYTHFLQVPPDNDAWVKFTTKTLNESGKAYEVGTLFNPEAGGLVIGSAEHGLWKSAVEMNAKGGKVKELTAYCGAVNPRMGDEPHGSVSGKSVSSPVFMVGCYEDWMDGMNEFADVNLQFQPKRKTVTKSVPIGWNSWGSVQSNLNYETAIGISDYVKENFQSIWQKDGEPVYINLDSYWDNLTDEELKAFVERCKANGQKAGIYIAPFIMWGDDDWQKTNFVPGTDGKVSYYDLRLKKSDGSLYGKEIDGCYPMDVTHPGARLHIGSIAERFKAAGFEYIKFDYLVHSAFEGDFYNKEIRTGIEAYNYAMGFLTDMLGEDMFINLAMSPTFPYQYANGRRFACDAYYSIGDTKYTLNSLTYGFWEQRLYDYTDPDHLVVWGKNGSVSESEAVARITSGVICGTSFLTGDDFVSPAGDSAAARERFMKTLANEGVIEAAKLGRAFIPVVNANCPETAEIYMLKDGDDIYVAMFNFTTHKKKLTAELPDGEYEATELWTGEKTHCRNELTASLDGQTAKLFKLS